MRRFVLLVAAVVGLAFAAPSLAGNITLHPAGFGEHSYAAWKAHQGLPDRGGSDDQSLYFQKFTATEVFAAGIAFFKGYEGLDLEHLDGLSFWWRMDGWCGAGAPRFNVRYQPEGTTDPEDRETLFVGCRGMAIDGTATYCPRGETSGAGCTWEKRTFPGLGAVAFDTGVNTNVAEFPAGTITSLSVRFDEGLTAGDPPVPLGPGFVHTDNIEVATSDQERPTKCFTGAQDNSNKATGPCPADPTAPAAALGLSVGTLSVTQPTVADLSADWPEVDPLAWVLYPNVLR